MSNTYHFWSCRVVWRYFRLNALIPSQLHLILIDIRGQNLFGGLCPPHFGPQTWLRAMGLWNLPNDFTAKYIAKVHKSWIPLVTPVVLLHFTMDVVCQCALLAAFLSQTHGFDGLGLLFEEKGACEAWYASKIAKVHTPRFRQIFLLKAWHLSAPYRSELIPQIEVRGGVISRNSCDIHHFGNTKKIAQNNTQDVTTMQRWVYLLRLRKHAQNSGFPSVN